MKSLHPPMNDARPRSVGRASRPAVPRLVTPRRHRLARCLALALALPLSLGAGSAHASSIELQSTFAGPIAAANRVCTAEPRALIYGTTNYNVGSALSYTSDGLPGPGYYVPANAPSQLDLEPAVLAGARSDLCVGLTLPPAAEPALIRTLAQPGDRLQDTPPWPDLADTHVVPELPGDPAPDGDDLRRLQLDLPAGTGLALRSQTTCAAVQFDAAGHADPTCPAGAQIGAALVRLSTWHEGQARHLVLSSAKLYLLAHGPDELARIGLSIRPLMSLAPAKVQFSLQASTTGRLRLVADELPRALYPASDVQGDGSLVPGAEPRPMYLESLGLRLWGSQDDHPSLAADLVASGTDCSAPAPAAIAIETYGGGTGAEEPAALALSGCGSLDHDPSAAITLTDPRPSAPTGATITLALGDSDDGRVPAHTTSAQITLPEGLHLGGQAASNGLAFCAAAGFAAADSAAADCPSASAVGTASLASELTIEPLRGTAYLLAPAHDGDVAGLALELAPSGASSGARARLKIVGRLREDDGRLSLRFDALPTLPVTSLALTLRGGDHSLLTAPPACGTLGADGRFTPTSGSPAETTTPVAITLDCDTPAPSVSAEIAATTPRPGARDGAVLSLTRTDRSPALSTFAARLPRGLMLDLRRAGRCERAAIDAGACDPSAALGTIQLRIGSGVAPMTLTAPLQRLASDDGALANALARVPVRLGDLDRGTADVGVAVGYDTQARRLVVAAALPDTADGHALDVQTVAIAFGPGIAVAPTACRDLSLTADAQLAGGGSATATGALSLSGCAEQPFVPAFRAALSGESAVGGHPRAALTLAPREGDANPASMTITLPAGLTIDGSAAACDAAAFVADGCPAAPRIGSVTAATSLAEAAVGGSLTLVRVPGQSAPGIGLAVSGSLGFRSLGVVSTVAGRQTVTFADLPDLPLTRLELVVDGGAAGALKVASPVCGEGAAWRAALGSHGGQSSESTAQVGCQVREAAPKVELSVKAKTGLKLKLSAFGGLRLQSAKLTLSPRLRFLPSAARRPRNTAVAVIGPKAKTSFSSTSLTVSVGAGRSPQEVVARVRWPAIVASTRGHRKTTFRLRLAFADGSVQVRDVLVTLPAKLPAPAPASRGADAKR